LRTNPITQQNEKFIQPIEASILAIDIAREPKYLVVGAVWQRYSLAIYNRCKNRRYRYNLDPAGNYNVYTLGYNVGNSTSKIYLNKDLPFHKGRSL
jgi:hypothetical protein